MFVSLRAATVRALFVTLRRVRAFASCRRWFIGKSIARKVNYSVSLGERRSRGEGDQRRRELSPCADIETGTTRLHALSPSRRLTRCVAEK